MTPISGFALSLKVTVMEYHTPQVTCTKLPAVPCIQQGCRCPFDISALNILVQAACCQVLEVSCSHLTQPLLSVEASYRFPD